MASQWRWIVALSLVLLACEQPQPTGWTRATHDDRGYTIVQADPERDTCIWVQLQDGENYWDEPLELDIVGLDGFHVASAWGLQPIPEYPNFVISRDCTTAEPATDVGPPAPNIRGTLEFTDVFRFAGRTRPCRVSFELEITEAHADEPTVTYSIVGRDVAILDVGCPHPDNVVATYTELDAAYGEVDGLATVVISSWDAANEVCVWARLLASPDAVDSPSEVEAPGSWTYSGLRVAEVEPEACVASNLLVPSLVVTALSTSVGPMSSTGTLTFGATATQPTASGPVEAPCTLDLDLELKSGGVYYWDPNLVRMQAEQVAVAGAC